MYCAGACGVLDVAWAETDPYSEYPSGSVCPAVPAPALASCPSSDMQFANVTCNLKPIACHVQRNVQPTTDSMSCATYNLRRTTCNARRKDVTGLVAADGLALNSSGQLVGATPCGPGVRRKPAQSAEARVPRTPTYPDYRVPRCKP